MKKTIRTISSLAFTLILLCGMTAYSFAAESSVTYQGNAKDFVFQQGSDYSPTDLFTNFKGVMPGDKITQHITVKNTAGKDKDVELFLRADGVAGVNNTSKADSADFLKEMTLTVKSSKGMKLFEGPADQTADLTKWKSLGKFKSGADVDLAVTLTVPLSMGNDFQERIGAINWSFKVEENDIPEPETPPGDNPGGDNPGTNPGGNNGGNNGGGRTIIVIPAGPGGAGGVAVQTDGNGGLQVTPIEDNQVPLAKPGGHHYCCIFHFLVMLAAIIVLGFYTRSRKKHQERIAELQEELETELFVRGVDSIEEFRERN